MSIIKTIGDSLIGANVPISYLKYSGKESTYITFQIITGYTEDYSDDINETNVYRIQVDLFSKTVNETLENTITNLLKVKFFDVKKDILYEQDTGYYHTVYDLFYYEYL